MLRINCGPCLFPDWRNSWVSLLCSILTLDVNDIGNHFRKHSSNRQRWKCVPHTCSESSDYLYIQARMQRKYSAANFAASKHHFVSFWCAITCFRAHNVLSFSPSLSLYLSFHFLPILSDMRWSLRHSKLITSAAAVLCKLQYSMVDWKGTIVHRY